MRYACMHACLHGGDYSIWWGRGAYSYIWHALSDRPLSTRPREDGALFPQERQVIVSPYFAKGGALNCFP
ncbi:unnamed protein product [Ectocarpus sp. 8 AP-2014]